MSIRKLNILMSYPVKWNIYKVMRDYVQNFYDAIGMDTFAEDFKYSFDEKNKTLIMESDVPFDKDWLMFMGASSKRDGSNQYAGKFGEGFKIASLIAYRDFSFSVFMASADWIIEVTQTDEIIDSQHVKCLAYDILERPYDSRTVLLLHGVKERHYEAFLTALEDFYYKDNPVFGPVLFQSPEYAIYELNPEKCDKHPQGRIYAGYQMRAYIELPLIICKHIFNVYSDDRDRAKLSTYQITECITKTFLELNPDQAYNVLIRLRAFWNGKSHRNRGIAPRIFLNILIQRVSESNGLIEKFQSEYADSIIASCPRSISPRRERVARSWFRMSGYYGKYQIVIKEFCELGIVDLEELCERHNGFVVTLPPNHEEQEYIELLRDAAVKHFSDIFQYDEIPETLVIINDEAPVDGQALSVKDSTHSRNTYGLRTQRVVDSIRISRSLLKDGSLGEALSTYLHELLHQYGGDSSKQFHRALELMNGRILTIENDIAAYASKWEVLHDRYKNAEAG